MKRISKRQPGSFRPLPNMYALDLIIFAVSGSELAKIQKSKPYIALKHE